MKTISFHIKVLKDLEKTDFGLRKQILELLEKTPVKEIRMAKKRLAELL